ncbi:hypothetical protein Tco_1140877 [Tanacetum coccineum]
MNQPQSVVSTQGTHKSTPRAHRTPTLTASPQGKKRKQSDGETSSPQKSLKVTIKQKKVVEGEKDEKSYANKLDASMIHDDVDDSKDRIEPDSHKEHPEVVVVDDDDNKDEKKDDEMGSLENKTENIATNDLIEGNLKRVLADTIIEERDAFQAEVPALISKEDVLKQDDAPPEGEKRVKRHKTSKSSKSARGSLSNQSAKESTTYVTKQKQQQQE